jgi:hypothetical protein
MANGTWVRARMKCDQLESSRWLTPYVYSSCICLYLPSIAMCLTTRLALTPPKLPFFSILHLFLLPTASPGSLRASPAQAAARQAAAGSGARQPPRDRSARGVCVDGRGEVDGAELLERSALWFMPNSSLNSPEKLAADTTLSSS